MCTLILLLAATSYLNHDLTTRKAAIDPITSLTVKILSVSLRNDYYSIFLELLDS